MLTKSPHFAGYSGQSSTFKISVNFNLTLTLISLRKEHGIFFT